jgi:hypothetical protein
MDNRFSSYENQKIKKQVPYGETEKSSQHIRVLGLAWLGKGCDCDCGGGAKIAEKHKEPRGRGRAKDGVEGEEKRQPGSREKIYGLR